MICSKCNVDKSDFDFYSRTDGDHVRRQCKSCIRSRKNANRAKTGRSPREIEKSVISVEKSRQKRKLGVRNARATKMLKGALKRAKASGVPYEMQGMNGNIQDRINAGRCELSGILFDLESVKAWNIPSIDRIEPALGYTPDNIRIVCFALNTAMGDWGFDKLAEIVDAVREQNKNCTETS